MKKLSIKDRVWCVMGCFLFFAYIFWEMILVLAFLGGIVGAINLIIGSWDIEKYLWIIRLLFIVYSVLTMSHTLMKDKKLLDKRENSESEKEYCKKLAKKLLNKIFFVD